LKQVGSASCDFTSRCNVRQRQRVHQGILVEQTPGLLVLRDAQNQTTRIAATEIERQATQPTSLMPEGLLRDLTAQQSADLLEYLASLEAR